MKGKVSEMKKLFCKLGLARPGRLLAGGLMVTCLLLCGACPYSGGIDLPDDCTTDGDPSDCVAQDPLRLGLTTFLFSDRSVLIRGDAEAGHATLTATTYIPAVFQWSLGSLDGAEEVIIVAPDDVEMNDVEVDGAGDEDQLTVTTPATKSVLRITKTSGIPRPAGTRVAVTVRVIEWLCDQCEDPDGTLVVDEDGNPVFCDDDGEQVSAEVDEQGKLVVPEDCAGEARAETVTLIVRRPEAPLGVSLNPDGGVNVQPGDSKRLTAVISGGAPFASGSAPCAFPPVEAGAVEATPSNNGDPYCVRWSVADSSFPASGPLPDDRLTVGSLAPSGLSTTIDATYLSPNENAMLTFKVLVVDADGNLAEREVAVEVLSRGEEEVALAASVDYPNLCSRETATITATAEGGTGNNEFDFDPVGTLLTSAGEALRQVGDEPRAVYTAPRGVRVNRTIRVTVVEDGGSRDQTTVVISTIGPGACNDNNFCTNDSCWRGMCQHDNNTAPCDDGNPCTDNDACFGGSCVLSSPKDCDDGNVCTDDSCSLDSGCVYTNNTASCDDGDFCTDGDTCDNGACMGGPPRDCDDGDPCTDGDRCDNGACVVGPPLDCDDGKDCTVDSCDSGSGCLFLRINGNCNDGNYCTGIEICDPDDRASNPITGCVEGTDPCAGGQLPVCDEVHDGCVQCLVDADCDDRVGCTNDSCNEGNNRCRNDPADANCDDGLFCNGEETCHPTLDCQLGADPCPGENCDEYNDACVPPGTP